MTDSLRQQAEIFAAYLIKEAPTAKQQRLYESAMAAKTKSVSSSSKPSTFQAAIHNPALLPFLDAHDAFFRPNSELRQRLYMMFSILETSPDFSRYFLPAKRSRWYMLVLPLIGIRAVCRLLIGVIVVRLRGLQ